MSSTACFPRLFVRNKLDIVQTDVVDDPTLQRSKNAICEKCNYNEAVFFQADEVCGMHPAVSKAARLFTAGAPLFLILKLQIHSRDVPNVSGSRG